MFVPGLSNSLGVLSTSEAFTDVTIHCKNKIKLKANKLILSYSSKLLKPLLTLNCDLAMFIPVTYDIVCPDFEPEAMRKVLEILYTGETYVDITNLTLYKEIKSILVELQIGMSLPDLGMEKDEPPVLCNSFVDIILSIKPETDAEQGPTESDSSTSSEKTGKICSNPVASAPGLESFMCHICDLEFESEAVLEEHSPVHYTTMSTADQNEIQEMIPDTSSTCVQSEIEDQDASQNDAQIPSPNHSFTDQIEIEDIYQTNAYESQDQLMTMEQQVSKKRPSNAKAGVEIMPVEQQVKKKRPSDANAGGEIMPVDQQVKKKRPSDANVGGEIMEVEQQVSKRRPSDASAKGEIMPVEQQVKKKRSSDASAKEEIMTNISTKKSREDSLSPECVKTALEDDSSKETTSTKQSGMRYFK